MSGQDTPVRFVGGPRDGEVWHLTPQESQERYLGLVNFNLVTGEESVVWYELLLGQGLALLHKDKDGVRVQWGKVSGREVAYQSPEVSFYLERLKEGILREAEPGTLQWTSSEGPHGGAVLNVWGYRRVN